MRYWSVALFIVSKDGLFIHFIHQTFQQAFYYFNIPLYTIIMIIAMYLNGAYDKPYTKKTSWLGFFSGAIMIPVIYAFLPMDLRSSRMVLVLGLLLISAWLLLSRFKLTPWRSGSEHAGQQSNRKGIIIAGKEEAARIKEIINRSKDHISIGHVIPQINNEPPAIDSLGSITHWRSGRIYRLKKLSFRTDVPFSVLQRACSIRAHISYISRPPYNEL